MLYPPCGLRCGEWPFLLSSIYKSPAVSNSQSSSAHPGILQTITGKGESLSVIHSLMVMSSLVSNFSCSSEAFNNMDEVHSCVNSTKTLPFLRIYCSMVITRKHFCHEPGNVEHFSCPSPYTFVVTSYICRKVVTK